MAAPSPRYRLRATLLPEGDRAVDLWVADGRLTFAPQDGAEELAPAGGYALAGLVDCHAHLTLDAGNTGLPLGSAELVAANRRGYLDAGVLLLRDIGAVSDATLGLPAGDGLPRVQPAGRFLAPPGGYFGIQQETAAADLAQVAVQQVAGGARWVKIIADWPHDGTGALVDLAHGGDQPRLAAQRRGDGGARDGRLAGRVGRAVPRAAAPCPRARRAGAGWDRSAAAGRRGLRGGGAARAGPEPRGRAGRRVHRRSRLPRLPGAR